MDDKKIKSFEVNTYWDEDFTVHLTVQADLECNVIMYFVFAITKNPSGVRRKDFTEGNFAEAVQYYNGLIEELKDKYKDAK